MHGNIGLAGGALALWAGIGLLGTAQEPDGGGEAAAASEYVCPPCGADCHDRTWERPGSCGVCGMTLVPVEEVTRVQLFLYPEVELYSAGALGGLFVASNSVLVTSVADTLDPLRSGGLSLLARHAFEDAPSADVLIVPDCRSPREALDDELLLTWLRTAAERARHVIAVGGGCALLAGAGLLDGVEVPVVARHAERFAALAPASIVRGDLDRTRSGRYLLARDAGAALELALELVEQVGGAPAVERTGARLGLAHDMPAEER